ncbi:RING finger protein nhl-1 [Hypsibius exemplaris]|uniref:RING finger protein nhl-1 n=1 Tax=Hypsibius exemplaris TaxID=2072580 RepID=A0A1W0WEA1_HYPEX|nr:RING finger protein nhl-1 [Hypsibius exemplaris]
MSGRRNIEPYDEENDEIAKEKKIIKAKMAAEAIEEAKKKALAPPPVVSHGHPGSADLEQLMTCCICMDRFRVPKMLPCQHSFCAHCLEDLYNCVKRQVKCPECRTEHHCSNPENFPTNLTMVRFMEVHIEAMGGDPADAMTGPPQMQKCGVCGDNAMLLNCGHCDRKVCTDCRDGHAETLKRELTRLTGQVKRGVSRLEESVGWIERNGAQLKTNCAAIKEEIQDSVRRYVKAIKDREELLLNQVNNFLQTESRSMEHMQDNLEEESKSLNTSVEEATKLLGNAETSIEDVMDELATFKEQFQKSLEFLKNFTPDSSEFTKSLKFLRGPSESDLLHQCIVAFGELHVNTMHFNRFVTASERMATQLVERQFEATLAEYNRQQQEEETNGPPARSRGEPIRESSVQPALQLSSNLQFQSEFMTRRVGEDLREYRDRRLESTSPSRYNASAALEFPSRTDFGARESSAPASYLSRVNRLTETSSSGTDSGSVASKRTSDAAAPAVGSSRRQKYKDSRAHTAELGALMESMDNSGRRGSGTDSLDGEVAEALASKGRYARRVESQESTESVSGAGRRQNRAKTSELNDYAVPEPVSNRLFQRETNTPESTGRSANSTRGGTSACEQAINRRRKRFGSVQSQSQDESTLSPAAAAAVYATPSSRPAYTAVSAGRETSPTSTVPSYRRARTPVLDDSDEDLLREAKDREERMPFYSRYLANKAKSREASPTGDYREKSAGRELGASSASSRDSAYLRKGRSSTKLGGRGSEDGQLNWPRGVAVTPNNRVLVADSSNHRVSIYDIEGAFIRSFGSYGSAPGEFDCLAGIAVSSDGKIIVSDRYNHRVSVHDPNGRHLLTFGSEGHLECQFQYPYGVAVSHNSIYVCDKDNARVQKFSLDGRFISKIGGPGVRTNSLNNPHFVCLSPTGDRVFVSDSGNNRIAVFDSRDGSQITSIGGEGTTDGKFQYPRGLAMDENEYLMVGDAGNNRVQIFGNRDYRFVSAFGSWGNVLGEFKGIEGVAVSHDGQILVADRDNHRIQVF